MDEGNPVISLLLQNFRSKAHAKSEEADLQELVGEANDPGWAALLQGLSEASAYALPALVDVMLSWRKAGLAAANQQEKRLEQPGLRILRKRLSIEVIFLEAALAVLLHRGGPLTLSERQGSTLQAFAFDWIINADRYIDSRYTELTKCRTTVVESCALMIGALAPTRLRSVVDQFLKEVCEPESQNKVSRLKSEAPAARQEIFQLCRGMRHVRIPVTTSLEAQQAVDSIEKLSPLRFVAIKGKTLVQYAMARMLTSMLALCVTRDEPRSTTASIDVASLSGWYNCMTAMRVALTSWNAKSSKHTAAAVPLQAQLLCLAKDSEFLRDVAPLMDALQRQLRGDYTRLLAALNPLGETEKKSLRDQSVRTSAVLCLRQCVFTYVRSFSDTLPALEVHRWLQKALSSIVTQLCRSNFPLPEQQMAIKGMMVDVGTHEPLLVIELLTKQMLCDPSNLEMIAIGLQSLLDVILTPACQAKVREMDPGQRSEAYKRLLAFMRDGSGVLEPLAAQHLQPLCSELLGSFMEASRIQTGFCHSTLAVSSKILADAAGKDKPSGVCAAWASALACIPLIMPLHWTRRPFEMAEQLAMLTIHTDHVIREEAMMAIRRTMSARSYSRGALLSGMATAYATLPDDCSQVVYKAALLVAEMIATWRSLIAEEGVPALAEDTAGGPLQGGKTQTVDGGMLDIALLEGYALSILCSAALNVREAGVRLLFAARGLHRALHSETSYDDDCCDRGSAHCVSSSVGGTLSGTPRSNLRSQLTLESPTAYVADVMQHAGDVCSLICSRATNLWSRLSEAPSGDSSFQSVLASGGKGRSHREAERWARTLAEVIKAASSSCAPSCINASKFVSQRLLNIVSKEAGGRSTAAEGIFDPERMRLARCFCALIMASPEIDGSTNSMATRHVLHLLFTAIRSCQEPQLSVATLALSCCHPSNYYLLPEHLKLFKDDGSIDRKSFRSRQRQVEVKLLVAQALEGVLDAARPGVLRREAALKVAVLDCISGLRRILSAGAAEVTMEMQQLRVCFAAVTKAAARDLGLQAPLDFPMSLRRQIFELMMEWSPDPTQAVRPGKYWTEVQRGFPTATGRVREPDVQRALEAELTASVPLIEIAAHSAMAALMLGPVFDKDTSADKNKPMMWINLLLTRRSTSYQAEHANAARLAAAIAALSNLLRSSPAELAPLFIDNCYSGDPIVANAYFQAVLETYSMYSIPIRTHVLLAVILYKVVDQVQSIREGTLHLLSVLSKNVWGRRSEGGGGGALDTAPSGTANPFLWPPGLPNTTPAAAAGLAPGEAAVPKQLLLVGTLSESYHAFQLQLSARLAREHPELTEVVVLEVMTRQLSASTAIHQHAMLSALAPWIENMSFAARWEGNWSERLLKAMYFVTQQLADAFPIQVEHLWATVAHNRRNIVPVLDFLLAHASSDSNLGLGLQTGESQFSVARRIVLWVARASSDLTIDHLLSEASRLIFEEDDGGGEGEGSGGGDDLQPPTPPRLVLPAGLGGSSAALPLPHSNVTSHELPQFSDTPVWCSEPITAEVVPWPDNPAAAATKESYYSVGSQASSGLPAKRHLVMSPSAGQLDRDAGGTPMTLSPQGSLGGSVLRDSSLFVATVEPGTPASTHSTHPQRPSTPLAAVPTKQLSRPGMATLLVAETILEHREAARRHAPLLAHLAVLAADDLAPTLAPPLLTYLLSLAISPSLPLRRLGDPPSERINAAGLLAQLQELTPYSLWPRQDPRRSWSHNPGPAPLASLVEAVVEALWSEEDLRRRWAAHAFHWALTARSPHYATRSHQVYRALGVPLNQDTCRQLLRRLQECLQHVTPASQLTASDVLLTLSAAVLATPANELLLYPQLFLTALSVLDLPFVQLHSAALRLFSRLLLRLDVSDPAVCSVVEACAAGAAASTSSAHSTPGRVMQRSNSPPQAWPLGAQVLAGRPDGWPPAAVQQLLVKGLFHLPTHNESLEVLTQLAMGVVEDLRRTRVAAAATEGPLCLQQLTAFPMAHTAQAGALLGEPTTQLAVSLLSSLPFLLPALDRSAAAVSCLAAHAAAAAALQQTHLAAALDQLSTNEPKDTAAAAQLLALPLSMALFPRYAKMALQRLMEVLQKGPLQAAKTALELLLELFKVPSVRLGVPRSFNQALLAPLLPLMAGPLSNLTTQVMEAMMAYCSTSVRTARPLANDPAHLSPSIGDTLPAAVVRAHAPEIDWPLACAPPTTEPAAVVRAVAHTASMWAAEPRHSSSGDGEHERPGRIPTIYRTLGERTSSATSSV